MPCLTLVASRPTHFPVSIAAIARITHFLDDCGITLVRDPVWIDPHVAVDLHLSDWLRPDHRTAVREALDPLGIDFFVHEATTRAPALFMADMDATIVIGETMNDLADRAGLGSAIADLTAQSMQGKMDFTQSFTRRVALLAGLPVTLLEDVRAAMTLQSGAVTLVQTLKKHGVVTVLVSGGLRVFTQHAADLCGFDHNHGNVIGIEDGKLTGAVVPPILGAEAKKNYLEEYRASLGTGQKTVLAVGDGANDIPMLSGATIGVGYHAKPIVHESIANQIRHGDLSTLLYLAGWPPAQWAHPH